MAEKKEKTKKDFKEGKKKSPEKEEVCEIFDVEKEGKEKEIVACGKDEIPHAGENEKKRQNKLLLWVFAGMGVIVLIFIAVFFYIHSLNNFEYKGVKFQAGKEGNIEVYKTKIPVMLNDQWYEYVLYLRNDPRELDSVAFEGESINLMDALVYNISGDDFKCDGDGIIAMANLKQTLNYIGIEMINDPNAGCDSENKYIFMKIFPGEETKIVQNSPTCYTLFVNNCEILKVTEKFMVEKLAEMKTVENSGN